MKYGGFSAGELFWERERRRCRGDGTPAGDLAAFKYFCGAYVRISHPLGRRLLVLREAQLVTAGAYRECDKVIVLKARQVGFTTLTMVWCLWNALFREDFKAINVSKKETDAFDALEKASFAFDGLPEGLRARLPERLDHNKEFVSFSNGSKIESHPSANNPARSRTASLMILDEWAFMPNPEEAWAAVEPVTDVGGKLVVLSTANGWGNRFHKMYVAARQGENTFRAVFFPWSAVPERDDGWYEQKRRDMSEAQLWQEYPSDDVEAFTRSGNTVFDLDVVRGLETRQGERGGFVSRTNRAYDFFYRPSPRRPVTVYERPLREHAYVVGADPSAGLRGGDFASAHVIDATDAGAHQVVAVAHGELPPDEFALLLARLSWWYNRALLGVEANNHGLAVIEELKRLNYPRLFRRKSMGRRRDRQLEQYGWWTSAQSKIAMIDQLGAALRNGDLAVWDDPTVVELSQYVREEKGTMHGSPHDDRVTSLAIGWQMVGSALAPEYESTRDPYSGTLQELVDGLHRDRRGRWVIGVNNVR